MRHAHLFKRNIIVSAALRSGGSAGKIFLPLRLSSA
jgi:hypothetical protein